MQTGTFLISQTVRSGPCSILRRLLVHLYSGRQFVFVILTTLTGVMGFDMVSERKPLAMLASFTPQKVASPSSQTGS